MMDRRPSCQVVLQGPRDCLARRDPQDPQVPKASKGYPDSQEPTDPQGSRVCPEIQAVKGSQDPRGSWDPEDPKAPQVCLDRTDDQALLACRGQLGPPGTGGFLEKSWGPSPDPEAMLDCPVSPG